MGTLDAAEVIKYLFGVVITIGGSYVVFIIKSISKDISQLKELLMNQIIDVRGDIEKHRQDINELYNLQRADSKEITEIKTSLQALRDEHNRLSCGVK